MIFDQFWSLLTYPYLISAVSYSSVRCICHRRGVILRLPWSYGPPFHTNNLNLVQNSSHHVSLNCSIIIWGPWRFYQDLFIVWRVPNSPIRKPAVSDRGIRTKLNRYTTNLTSHMLMYHLGLMPRTEWLIDTFSSQSTRRFWTAWSYHVSLVLLRLRMNVISWAFDDASRHLLSIEHTSEAIME